MPVRAGPRGLSAEEQSASLWHKEHTPCFILLSRGTSAACTWHVQLRHPVSIHGREIRRWGQVTQSPGVSLGVGSVAPRQLTRGKGQGPGRGSLSSPSPQHTGRWNWARRGLQGHTKKLGPA